MQLKLINFKLTQLLQKMEVLYLPEGCPAAVDDRFEDLELNSMHSCLQ